MILAKTVPSIGIPIFYFFVGSLAIWFSNTMLFNYLMPITNLTLDQAETILTLKGIFYVALTAGFLFFLISAYTRHLNHEKNEARTLFAQNPNPMWVFEPKTQKIILVNEAACWAYGYTEAEFLQLSLLDLRPKSEHQKLLADVQAVKSGLSDRGEWLHQNKSGEQFYVNIFSSDITHRGKTCRLVTAVNIDKIKRAELDRQNFKLAIDNSALTCIIDLNQVIKEVNDRFADFFQYTKDDLIGKNHSLIISRLQNADFLRQMANLPLSGKAWRADVHAQKKDGSYCWMDVAITPVLDAMGKMYNIMLVGNDITERKNLEHRIIRQNQKLTEIAWQQSHGVRKPLATILGLCHLLLDHEHNTEEDTKLCIDYLYQTAQELDVIVHKVLEQTDHE
jgi:PAS domain S-box-containing protein